MIESDKLSENIKKVARLIHGASHAVALTGAGISVDSGLPDFRGSQGLWSKYDPAEYATIDAFMADPEKVWNMLFELRKEAAAAEPNPAHTGLAELERMGHLTTIVTQNVDGLHQRAGSSNVIEFHGGGTVLSCIECFREYPASEISLDHLPPLCLCGGVLKPDIVLYGETIPVQTAGMAQAAAEQCDLMFVIGTSAEVAPASSLPRTAKSVGAKVVEINIEPTVLTASVADISLQGSSSKIIPAVVTELKTLEFRS
jgi:NAD-dependent deacetylase